MIDHVYSSTTHEELVVKLRDLAIGQGAPPLVIGKLDDLMRALQRAGDKEPYDAGYADGLDDARARNGTYMEGWEAGYLEGCANAERERDRF